MGLALFADLGKAWSTLSNEASDLQVDVGAGLRLKPIGDRRTLRIDAAWGVRDGEFAISAGWMLPWPGWR
jgi:outer membrane translocation and assembly module TamA